MSAARPSWYRKLIERTPRSAGSNEFHRKHFDRFVSWREFNRNVNISLKHEYLYISVPKAACTTIKYRLQSMECAELPISPKLTHTDVLNSPFTKPYQLSGADLKEVFFGDRFFRFSFVRNPHARVLSSYLEKIARHKALRAALLKHFEMQDCDGFEFTFEKFLHLISQQTPKQMDKHWRPQSTLLFFPKVRFDLIGRVEAFDDDWQTVVENIAQTGGRLMSEKTQRAHATDAANEIHQYYDKSTWNTVGKVYAADFKAFGYSKTFPDRRVADPEPSERVQSQRI